MKLFKKAKDLFNKMTGRAADAPPGPRPPPTPPKAAVLPKLLPKYQREQRDFRARAKAVTVFWDSAARGTYRRPTVIS